MIKMYQLYMGDRRQIKKVAVLPNSLGPGSWKISYCEIRSTSECCLDLQIYTKYTLNKKLVMWLLRVDRH